jgi:hypothetical protein
MTDTSTAMNQMLRRGRPNAQEEQRERGVAPEELRNCPKRGSEAIAR